MKKEEKLKLMNDLFNTKECLTSKELKMCGFATSEVTKLVSDGIIIRASRGKYELTKSNIEEFLKLGREALKNGDFSGAEKYFEECLKHSPNDKELNLLLASTLVSQKKYEQAFSLLKYYSIDYASKEDLKEINMYLYLLSLNVNLSDTDKLWRESITLDDITFTNKECKIGYYYAINQIILNVYYQKEPYALERINALINNRSEFTFQYKFIRSLIYPLVKKKTLREKTILNLIKNKKYETLEIFLNKRKENVGLSLRDGYILSVAKNIINIKNTGIIPNVLVETSDKLSECLKANDYSGALKLCESHNEKFLINSQEDPLTLLLLDINELIDATRKTPNKEEKKIEQIDFTDIVQSLLKQDIDNSFIIIKKYLESIDKSEYEFLILNLIKLSALEKDIIFTKPLLTLTEISKDTFIFNINDYIEGFNESLSKKETEKMKVYLEILNNSKKLGVDVDITDLLMKALEPAILNSDKEEITSTSKEKVEETKEVVIEEKEQILPTVKQNRSKIKEISKDDSDYKFVNEKLKKLEGYGVGIALLKPMDRERRRKIHKIVETIPQLRSFSIGADDERRIVLRYSPWSEKIAFNEVIKLGNQYYKNRDYAKSVKEYEKLLLVGEPPHYVYSKIGLCHLRLGHKELAIDYLTVGNALGKEANSQFDYSDLLFKLTNPGIEDDKKIFVMTENEFETNQNEYGIPNLYGIVDYYSRNREEVGNISQEFDLTEEEANIVRIMCVREDYTKDDYDKGDKLLRQVERSEHKNPLVKKLFDETIKNKRFYRNRKNSD